MLVGGLLQRGPQQLLRRDSQAGLAPLRLQSQELWLEAAHNSSQRWDTKIVLVTTARCQHENNCLLVLPSHAREADPEFELAKNSCLALPQIYDEPYLS